MAARSLPSEDGAHAHCGKRKKGKDSNGGDWDILPTLPPTISITTARSFTVDYDDYDPNDIPPDQARPVTGGYLPPPKTTPPAQTAVRTGPALVGWQKLAAPKTVISDQLDKTANLILSYH